MNEIDPKLIGQVKKLLKTKHQELMAMVPPEERGKLNTQINAKIHEAKSGQFKGGLMNNFMKDIYGR